MQSIEILNDKKLQELFGMNYAGVLVYSYDTKSYNKKTYHGKPMVQDTALMNSATRALFEKRINAMPEFADKYKIAGFAVMAIDCPDYPNNNGWCADYNNKNVQIHDPQYNRLGLQVAGTIIVRDISTGKILPVPNKWLLVTDGRFIPIGKSYLDGAQKNLDSITANHQQYAHIPKSAKLIEKFTRKRDTARRIAKCANRRELASTMFHLIPSRGTNAKFPNFCANLIGLYNPVSHNR